MKHEILEQMDGYGDIAKEIEISRKYGQDFSMERGEVARYINRLHPATIKYKITEIIDESPSTKTFRLAAQNNYLPPFQAGQYVSLFLEVNNIRTSRPYSISSSPDQTGHFDITVRRMENGLISNYMLDSLVVGDEIESSGPTGVFHYNPLIHDKTMVCLAGGCGITPFMSMVREITSRGLDRTIYLFYGSQGIDDMPFHSELTELSNKFNNINYIPVLENPDSGSQCKSGFITGDLIKDVLGGVGDKSFFICGPQAMYNFCVPELEKLGIARRKIRREMFGTPARIVEYNGWPDEIKGEDLFQISVNGSESFQSAAGVSLLVALENQGLVVPSICRSGECSMCRVKILSGKVFQPAGTPVRASDSQFGYAHSCVSYPLENLDILL